MPEYLGYKVPEEQKPLDFAGITAKITSDIKNAQDKKQAERDAIDQHTLNTQIEVDNAQLEASKTHDEMMYDGAVDAREKLHVWQKELKAGRLDPRDFSKLKNKMLTNINNYKNYMVELGTLSSENMKRMQEDEDGRILASWAEGLQVSRRDQMNDPGNLTMSFSDIDGGMVFVEKDAEGNVLRTTTQPQMMNMRNMYDNRYYMDDDIAGFADKLAEFKTTEKVKGGTQTSAGPMVNPEYRKVRSRIINTILPVNDTKRVADVLLDNGGYYNVSDENLGIDYDIVPQTYETPEQLESLVENEVAEFLNGYKDSFEEGQLKEMAEEVRKRAKEVMIGVSYDNAGMVHPNINDTHKAMAEDVVDYSLSSQLGQTDIFKPKAASSNGSSGSVDKNENAANDKKAQLYLMTKEAINGNYGGLKNMFDYNKGWSTGILTITPKAGFKMEKLLELGFEPGTEEIDLNDPLAGERLAKYVGSSTPSSAASDFGFGRDLVENKGYIPMARRETKKSEENKVEYAGLDKNGSPIIKDKK